LLIIVREELLGLELGVGQVISFAQGLDERAHIGHHCQTLVCIEQGLRVTQLGVQGKTAARLYGSRADRQDATQTGRRARRFGCIRCHVAQQGNGVRQLVAHSRVSSPGGIVCGQHGVEGVIAAMQEDAHQRLVVVCGGGGSMAGSAQAHGQGGTGTQRGKGAGLLEHEAACGLMGEIFHGAYL